MGLRLYGINRHFVYADDVNLLGDGINSMQKIAESFIDNSEDIGLDRSIERTRCLCLLAGMQGAVVIQRKQTDYS
jgi:hypothetical protein